MALIARIFGVALLASALVVGHGLALINSDPNVSPYGGVVIIFVACVAGVIGAIAGAAREVVSAQRKKAPDGAEIR